MPELRRMSDVIIEFDEAKNAWNIRERGLSSSRVTDFDFGTADVKLVQRNGELRWVATGYLDGVLHLLCFVGGPEVIRVISFRIASRKERRLMSGKEIWSDKVCVEVADTEDWTDDEGEVLELSEADFARMKPVSELAPELQEMLRGLRAGSLAGTRRNCECAVFAVGGGAVSGERDWVGGAGGRGAAGLAGSAAGELATATGRVTPVDEKLAARIMRMKIDVSG